MTPERRALLRETINVTDQRRWSSMPGADATATAELLAELAEELLAEAVRDYPGFVVTTKLTGSIERVEVTIDAEFIERLWPNAINIRGHDGPLAGSVFRGRVGRFELWERDHGEVWAASEDWGVMVVAAKAKG